MAKGQMDKSSEPNLLKRVAVDVCATVLLVSGSLIAQWLERFFENGKLPILISVIILLLEVTLAVHLLGELWHTLGAFINSFDLMISTLQESGLLRYLKKLLWIISYYSRRVLSIIDREAMIVFLKRFGLLLVFISVIAFFPIIPTWIWISIIAIFFLGFTIFNLMVLKKSRSAWETKRQKFSGYLYTVAFQLLIVFLSFLIFVAIVVPTPEVRMVWYGGKPTASDILMMLNDMLAGISKILAWLSVTIAIVIIIVSVSIQAAITLKATTQGDREPIT